MEHLTHYSSTAFVAYYITPKVLLHELDGQPTPEIYKQFGFNIVSDSSQILSSFKDDTLFFKNKSNSILDNIAPIPNVHPNKKIAKLILNEK